MKRRIKLWMFILLILLQIVVNRHINELKLNLDLFFLILVYISIKSNFLPTILSATAIGLLTDFFSGNVLGVFGFSRTIAAYLIHEISTYLDLRRNIFLFLLIVIPMFISNLTASIFFYFILNFKIGANLVLYSPLLTGILGVLILSPRKMKQYLDVY